MPKIVTEASRIAETERFAQDLAIFIRQGNWKAAAEAAGQIQRRTRLLAGLGRGG